MSKAFKVHSVKAKDQFFVDLTGFKYRDGDFRHGENVIEHPKLRPAWDSICLKISYARNHNERVIVTPELLERILDKDPAIFEGLCVCVPKKGEQFLYEEVTNV